MEPFFCRKLSINMKNTIIQNSIYLLIGATAITATSCKKGSEDPFISLKSRKNRLVGKWIESETKTKGFDVDTKVTLPEMVFEEDGDYKFDMKFTYNYNGTVYSETYIASGKWAFNDKKDQIILSNMKYGNNDDFLLKVTYDILGLSNNNLHLDGDWVDGNDKYEFDWTATKR